MAKAKKEKKYSFWGEVARRFSKNRSAMIGLYIFIVMALLAVMASIIVDYDYSLLCIGKDRLQGPSWEHICGTDNLGRDLFARLVHGAQVSMSIGLLVCGVSLIVGGLIGASAAYIGGVYDLIVMRIMDIFAAVPSIMLSLTIVAALGGSLFNLLMAITISSTPGRARSTRAYVLSVTSQEHVEAAKSYGAGALRIIIRYVVPNAMGPIIVSATMSIASMILMASALSFIGMGIQPPRPEWGSMLNESRPYMRTKGYLLYFPGLCIIFSALAFNLIGDGLRDALDPRLKD